jgi:L-rhamnose-H+ transport protein
MDVGGGILWHGVGASAAAVCYTPQRKVFGWAWHTWWLAQATVCWLLMPFTVAYITIPHLAQVLSNAPASAMYKSFFLGMAYGIGGTAFGLAIRYAGFSLTYAISVGISCVLGTLLPPWVAGILGDVFQQRGSGFLALGIAFGALGIALCGWAGFVKEKKHHLLGQNLSGFSMKMGLPLCLVAGILSAMYGFAIDQGQPIADEAAKLGSGQFQTNVVYIFSNSGAFVTTLIYCSWLHFKNRSWKQHISINEVKKGITTGSNYLWASLTGVLWFGQFLFYGMGHIRMGTYKFSSWAIHMIMLVLFSSLVGIILKEWTGSPAKAKRILTIAILFLFLAVFSLTYGNYLGEAVLPLEQ